LSDFRQKAGETLDRINRTGNAEILTVNGEARAVLLSPAAYDEIARDAELTRRRLP
jgi:prevent-host-death family protein